MIAVILEAGDLRRRCLSLSDYSRRHVAAMTEELTRSRVELFNDVTGYRRRHFRVPFAVRMRASAQKESVERLNQPPTRICCSPKRVEIFFLKLNHCLLFVFHDYHFLFDIDYLLNWASKLNV